MSVGPSSSATVPIEEAMWKMNLGGNEAVESGPYPQRPGDLDCTYYIRTGLCRFGMTCRYNHPPNRKLAIAAARIKGEYPERVGQPECQYYLKTGTCKYGATCKFHHPRDKAGIAGRVQLNILGYPVRPNEEECSYYLRTGLCKFGNTCKFHHPQPTNDMVSIRGSTVYSPGQQSYSGGVANWPLSRGFIASPRWQGPSSYPQGPPLILPQGLVQLSSWNTFPASLGSVSSPERQQQTTASAQGEKIFPERPEQPECQFYMKTGDCKFGAVCRFHHPKDRLLPAPNCMFSHLGLPLRPGEPICIFYSRYGICKFGPNCKFDHPVGTFMYGFPPPSALMLSSEGSSEAKQIPPSESPENEEN